MDQAAEAEVAASTKLLLAGFVLDLGWEELRDAAGRPVELRPQAYRVLRHLALNAGRLVTKAELLGAVWPDLVVTDDSLVQAIGDVRHALGDEAHRIVKTVPRRGYLLAADAVAAMESDIGAEPAPAHSGRQAAGEAPPRLRRLSVIVLPFLESGAPSEQAYFADAITDDITTQLSKIKGSYVIGSPTAFAYRRESFDLPSVARDLGVRYVLHGRIERSAEGIETNVRLSDAATGSVIWSDAVQVGRQGTFNIRREVVARLTMALGLQLMSAEARRSAADDAVHPEAIDLVMQAQTPTGGVWSREAHEASVRLCTRALDIEPDLGAALAGRAFSLVTTAGVWPGPDIETRIAQAERDILRALEQDACDPMALLTLSRVRHLQFRLPAAIAAVEQALEVSPNHSDLLSRRAIFAVYSGESELAFDPLHRALALSPRDPARWSWLLFLGIANLLLGRYEQAVVWLEKSCAQLPYWGTLRMLTAAYGHLGQVDQAQAVWRQMLPDPAAANLKLVRWSNHPVLLRQAREHIGGGLLKAGVDDAMERIDKWEANQRPGAGDCEG